MTPQKSRKAAEKKVSNLGLRMFTKKCDVNHDPYFVYHRSIENDDYTGLYDNMTKSDAIIAAAGLFVMYEITKDEIENQIKELIYGKGKEE